MLYDSKESNQLEGKSVGVGGLAYSPLLPVFRVVSVYLRGVGFIAMSKEGVVLKNACMRMHAQSRVR